MFDVPIAAKVPRRPRFRRAASPPAFCITDNDVKIIRLVARHRFLRSTHIAVLVGRSLDRANDRLCRLFHAGYVDRPRAQRDHYAAFAPEPMVYALANRGAKLLSDQGIEIANVEWSRKNAEAERPFIEHQLQIVDFYVALQLAVRGRGDIRLVHPEELVAAFPAETRALRNPLAMRVTVPHNGNAHEIGLIPDLIFGIAFPDGSRKCFMVEIDRGTMPITRTNLMQTSFEQKMRAYLTAQAARQHEQQFGWKTFRVLTVTTDQDRARSMLEALAKLNVPQSLGPTLFFFALRDELQISDPFGHRWRDGTNRAVSLQ